jgi:hypothetical protein
MNKTETRREYISADVEIMHLKWFWNWFSSAWRRRAKWRSMFANIRPTVAEVLQKYSPMPFCRWRETNFNTFCNRIISTPTMAYIHQVSISSTNHCLIYNYRFEVFAEGIIIIIIDRLCDLVVRVSGYRSRGAGFDSRRYHIFWEVVGLERGSLSLVSTTEELLGRNSRGCGLENREYCRGAPLRWPRDTLYPQKLALTSPTWGGCSVGRALLRIRPRRLFFVIIILLLVLLL